MGKIRVSDNQRHYNQFIKCCLKKKTEIQTKKEEYERNNPGKSAFAYHCCTCHFLKLLKHIEPIDIDNQETKFICQICDKKRIKSISESIEQISDSDDTKTETQSNISYNEDFKLFEIGEEF